MIIITGQTATGKTKLALEYAKKCNGEIINCDSRQIYRYLDIITGKDLPDNQKKFQIIKKINHFFIGYYPIYLSNFCTKIWLYDIVEPKEYFSSYDWVKCAQIAINYIKAQKKIPIIVGGTYFYLKHLLYGFETESIPPNWMLRKKLEKESLEKLQNLLKKINNKIFNQLNQSDKNNSRRLIRKIEIELWKKENSLKTNLRKLSLSNKKFIGLRFKDKNNLKETIIKRVKKRIELGAFEEVERLIKLGYNENDPGLNTIGYKEILLFLNKKITYEEAINQWIIKEIQYTKRQLTFMKKDKNIEWIEV